MSNVDAPVVTALVPVLAVILVAIADVACHLQLMTCLARKRVLVAATVTWVAYYLALGVLAASQTRVLETVVSALVAVSAAWWATHVQSRSVAAE